jgi:REP element-mobilizing transposase RayT
VTAVRSLRSARLFPTVRRALAAASRAEFRIVEFTVQNDHIHLIAEAENGRVLSGGVRGLAIRLARAVNRVLRRRGQVWADRYHARALTTPRAVRHALIYVLANFRKHLRAATGIDPCSSAPWFTGWRVRGAPAAIGPPPIARARTWLARIGWRKHGLLGLEEQPKGRRPRSR